MKLAFALSAFNGGAQNYRVDTFQVSAFTIVISGSVMSINYVSMINKLKEIKRAYLLAKAAA